MKDRNDVDPRDQADDYGDDGYLSRPLWLIMLDGGGPDTGSDSGPWATADSEAEARLKLDAASLDLDMGWLRKYPDGRRVWHDGEGNWRSLYVLAPEGQEDFS